MANSLKVEKEARHKSYGELLDGYSSFALYSSRFGAWRSPASALALGARGPGFKSQRPDKCISFIFCGAENCNDIMSVRPHVWRGAPWVLVRVEGFTNRSEAVRHERKIKGRGIERYLADNESSLPG